MNINKKLKAIALSLGLAAMTLTANNLNAQNDGSRSMFGRGASPADNQYGNSKESLLRQGEPTIINGGGITNDGFGINAPLGSGIAILIGAGLGYVALKKKEDEQ